METPTKAERTVLERIYSAEIESRLPCQFRKESAALVVCFHKGWCERMTIKLPGRFTVTVTGWNLTHAGRAAYCATC